jgi:hypothetical protein
MGSKLKTASKSLSTEAGKSHGVARQRIAHPPVASAQPSYPVLGNQTIQQLFQSGALQAKLAVGSVDDPLEKEADRIADHVTRAPAPSPLCRQCASGSSTSNPECDACRARNADKPSDMPLVQRRAARQAGPAEAPSIVHDVLGDHGEPLDPTTRADMEGRFDTDFADVRIHAGQKAAQSAKSVGALAYTVGSNIAFGEQQYAPRSDVGRRLLAHELVHVRQQLGGAPLSLRRQTPTPAPASTTPADPSAQNEPKPPAATAESPETKDLVDAALESQDPSDVKKIKNFAGVSDDRKFMLIGVLLNQAWVGPFDEYALEAIWGSFGDRVVTVASSAIGAGLWQSSIDRGAELEDLPAIQKLRADFRTDVIALARGYLESNDALVVAESANAGISLEDQPAAGPPTEDQQKQTQAMQAAAESVAHVQEEMEHSRQVYVGYSLGNLPPEAKQYWLPVTFDPFHPPQRPDAPVIDLNDPSPMADHHPVVNPLEGPPKLQPYDTVLDAYKMGLSSIRTLTTKYPLLYAITREGKSAATQDFAKADPATARQQLGAALRKLRADITQAKGKLGNELDPLDLAPLQEQLFLGMAAASKTNWSLALPQQQAHDLIKGHEMRNALIALGLETVSQMAFMIGGLLPGAGGVAASVVGLAAAGIKANISGEQYQAMLQASKTAVAPGTELVTEAQVDDARARATADQAALTLAMLNTAAAVAGAASSWAATRLANARSAGAPGEAAAPSKALALRQGDKIASGDEINLPEAAPQSAQQRFVAHVIDIDPETGEAFGVIFDRTRNASATFRINVNTGDGVVTSGGRTRVVVGGVLQPERAALPPAGGSDTTPTAPGPAKDTDTPPPALGPPSSDPQPKALPGAPEPNRLPPAGGFDNAFPKPEPFGTDAEPNIGRLYPGMRQLPAGYPAYDFVRGGTTTAKFTVESLGTPRTKQTVLNLTVEGGEWLSAKTVLDAKDATPEHIEDVVNDALKDMEEKSGRKAAFDPKYNWYVRVNAASPERVILDIHVPGEARASVPALQAAAQQAVTDSGWSPGVPVEVRVMSWR